MTAQPGSEPSDSTFTHDVARFYESTLVPLIFQPYADDLAARVRALAPDAVLEIACGTGVVTRALARALPETCTVTATDLNQAMVTHAEHVGTAREVLWAQADVMALPYADASFDVVVCQFGVMFFPDRVAAYREVRRVLRPGGTFVFNVWNSIDANDFADVVTTAVSELFPGDPALFLARTPHGHGAPDALRADVAAAGFSACTLAQRDEESVADSAAIPAVAYCHGTPLRNEIEARAPGELDRVTAVAADALRARFGDGPVRGRVSAVVVTAR